MIKIITPLMLAISLTSVTCAANLDSVPLPADFKYSLQIADDYPLIQTGYVAQSITKVSAFYQQALGKSELIIGDNKRRRCFIPSTRKPCGSAYMLVTTEPK
ncbi:hypothetical protein [Pseudoalteromonas sp. SR41-4]|uniref:hypothetical protein n=1 Tax=Pseudoalteromonas sp. SR41-4 TaxID=2760950 RepID=UPI0016008CF2|nr:hypothetical protein [Pseudoalteromonas sp. SR41-4]MBB1295640.1 hypothetical protein [Pseudoalteromonas sp. SR41-4]